MTNFVKNNSGTTTNLSTTVTSSFTIDDIKKEIADFQKLDPTSSQKIAKYKTIRTQLDTLDKEGKWTSDVAQLKTILNTEYYRGFNIVLVNQITDQNVYNFSSLEKNTIGVPLQLFYNKSFSVAGDKGVVLGGISDDVRGTNVTYSLGMTAATCTTNLLKNGIYCIAPDGTIFNTTKAGSEDVQVQGETFPEGVVGLSTFGSSNFYVLVKNTSNNNNGVYVIKYTNALGSETNFNPGVSLPLIDKGIVSQLPAGFSSLTIDGTFLLWSADKKTLYQMSRSANASQLDIRPVPIKGGTDIDNGFSDSVKPITFADSKYVYLFDKKSQSLSVYTTNPVKTNDAYTTSYTLTYLMRMSFSIPNNTVVDAAIDETSGREILYILHNDGIAKFDLTDYLSSFASGTPAQ